MSGPLRRGVVPKSFAAGDCSELVWPPYTSLHSNATNTAEHALISLLALNGLRVSEAIGAVIEALGLERGHRTLTVLRKGGTVVTVPLAPRTARAVWSCQSSVGGGGVRRYC